MSDLFNIDPFAPIPPIGTGTVLSPTAPAPVGTGAVLAPTPSPTPAPISPAPTPTPSPVGAGGVSAPAAPAPVVGGIPNPFNIDPFAPPPPVGTGSVLAPVAPAPVGTGTVLAPSAPAPTSPVFTGPPSPQDQIAELQRQLDEAKAANAKLQEENKQLQSDYSDEQMRADEEAEKRRVAEEGKGDAETERDSALEAQKKAEAAEAVAQEALCEAEGKQATAETERDEALKGKSDAEKERDDAKEAQKKAEGERDAASEELVKMKEEKALVDLTDGKVGDERQSLEDIAKANGVDDLELDEGKAYTVKGADARAIVAAKKDVANGVEGAEEKLQTAIRDAAKNAKTSTKVDKDAAAEMISTMDSQIGKKDAEERKDAAKEIGAKLAEMGIISKEEGKYADLDQGKTKVDVVYKKDVQKLEAAFKEAVKDGVITDEEKAKLGKVYEQSVVQPGVSNVKPTERGAATPAP